MVDSQLDTRIVPRSILSSAIERMRADTKLGNKLDTEFG